MGLRHLRSPELLLGEVDGPEWNPEPENGATSNKKSELKLPVGHLLDFVHLWCMHVVRGIRATHVHRAGGVEPPRGGSLPSRDETSDGKKGSVSENSKPGEEKSSGDGRGAGVGVWSEVRARDNSPAGGLPPWSRAASARSLPIATPSSYSSSPLLYSKQTLVCALARFDFQTLKFEIGFLQIWVVLDLCSRSHLGHGSATSSRRGRAIRAARTERG